MPVFTDAQRHAIRFFTGWSEGYTSVYQRVEQAMDRVQQDQPVYDRIVNAIDGNPPGILAWLEQTRLDVYKARGRLKASVVGSITLNAGEVQALRQQGAELACELAQVLGIPRRRNVFSASGVDSYATLDNPSPAGGGGNYVGK